MLFRASSLRSSGLRCGCVVPSLFRSGCHELWFGIPVMTTQTSPTPPHLGLCKRFLLLMRPFLVIQQHFHVITYGPLFLRDDIQLPGPISRPKRQPAGMASKEKGLQHDPDLPKRIHYHRCFHMSGPDHQQSGQLVWTRTRFLRPRYFCVSVWLPRRTASTSAPL